MNPKKHLGLSVAPGTHHVWILTRPGASTADLKVFYRHLLNVDDTPYAGGGWGGIWQC